MNWNKKYESESGMNEEDYRKVILGRGNVSIKNLRLRGQDGDGKQGIGRVV